MKVNYTTPSGKFSVELEGSHEKDIFEKVGNFQEVFENDTCSACDSNNVKFTVREVDSNKFYELQCRSCFSKLRFGFNKDGSGMYPKRSQTDEKGKVVKDKNGKSVPLGKNGWHKFTKNEAANVTNTDKPPF